MAGTVFRPFVIVDQGWEAALDPKEFRYLIVNERTGEIVAKASNRISAQMLLRAFTGNNK